MARRVADKDGWCPMANGSRWKAQLQDMRSSEIARRFTAKHRGAKPVLLLLRSLTPRTAEGVTSVDVRDTSERAVEGRARAEP